MLINTLTNVNKWYLIVKCFQFLIEINVFGTQNEMTDRDTHNLICDMKKKLNDTSCTGKCAIHIYIFIH